MEYAIRWRQSVYLFTFSSTKGKDFLPGSKPGFEPPAMDLVLSQHVGCSEMFSDEHD